MGYPVTGSLARRDGELVTTVRARAFRRYLRRSGWVSEDEARRVSLWRPPAALRLEDFRVTIVSDDFDDYLARTDEALRTVAYVEGRVVREVAADVTYGGADTLAVRLVPDAPSGEAPLELAQRAIDAVHNLVAGSASALEVEGLVLPSRRPARAEAYAGQARLATAAGSFVLLLALPLFDDDSARSGRVDDPEQLALIDVPVEPYGRRVSDRIVSTVRRAQLLADQVNIGEASLRSFGDLYSDTPNATELEALGSIGGLGFDPYQFRIATSPLAGSPRDAVVLSINPGQQRVFVAAADFLRTKQPRPGVSVVGLVVRLFRQASMGPGEVVVQGLADDTQTVRRYRVELAEANYGEAVRAHANGLQVDVRGDLEVRGNRLSIRPLSSFAVLPGLDDE